MDKAIEFANFILSNYGYDSFNIKQLKADDYSTHVNYINKVQHYINLNKHSDYALKLDYIASKVDCFVIECIKKFKSVAVTDYIVCADESVGDIRCYGASNSLSDIDVLLREFDDLKIRFFVGSVITALNYGFIVKYHENGIHHNTDYGFHFKHSVILHNKNEDFGKDISGFVELETIVLKYDHVSEDCNDTMIEDFRIIVNLYSNKVLLGSQSFDFDFEFTKDEEYTIKFNNMYFKLFEPFRTDLSEYMPLNFEKELTLDYINNFNTHIAGIQAMRDY
jgi:hypothetical protein